MAFPPLAALLDQVAMADAAKLAPDGAEMLQSLVQAALSLGEYGQFAALAEVLRGTGNDFDGLITEIAGQGDIDPELARLELNGAIRQMRMQALRAEADHLVARGLADEASRQRWREIMGLLEQLKKQPVA
jgi:DNA primase